MLTKRPKTLRGNNLSVSGWPLPGRKWIAASLYGGGGDFGPFVTTGHSGVCMKWLLCFPLRPLLPLPLLLPSGENFLC